MNWKDFVQHHEGLPYLQESYAFITEDRQNNDIYPAPENVFKAFELCDVSNIKVVLLGQDPYHQPDQAMGLAFSVPEHIRLPPSLTNIFKELHDDVGIIRKNGDLTTWATQGVLLLNTSLTVQRSCPNSHKKYWQEFTNNVITHISQNAENVVFMLWGNHAKSKKKYIDESKHHILEANHPSPMSANRGGWYGTKHFSKCNAILKAHNYKEINW